MRQCFSVVGRQPTASKHGLNGPLELMGEPMLFTRNAKIFAESEPADYLYKIVSGAVRVYNMLGDGRRHIGAFYLAGDLFGLEAGTIHTLSAEAIINSAVLAIERSAVMALAARDGDMAPQCWSVATSELERSRRHALLLLKTAPERVASFLLEMARRVPGSKRVELPMSRQDIADYLGLTVETVSRTLKQLATETAIALPTPWRVELCDPTALNRPAVAVRKQGQRR